MDFVDWLTRLFVDKFKCGIARSQPAYNWNTGVLEGRVENWNVLF